MNPVNIVKSTERVDSVVVVSSDVNLDACVSETPSIDSSLVTVGTTALTFHGISFAIANKMRRSDFAILISRFGWYVPVDSEAGVQHLLSPILVVEKSFSGTKVSLSYSIYSPEINVRIPSGSSLSVQEVLSVIESVHDEVASMFVLCEREVEMRDKLAGVSNSILNDHRSEFEMSNRKSLNSTVPLPVTFDENPVRYLFEHMDDQVRGKMSSLFRPQSLSEIIGQNEAIELMLLLLDSDLPLNVILHGPPGVGKTTAARAVFSHLQNSTISRVRPDSPFIEADGTALYTDKYNNISQLLGHFSNPTYHGSSSHAKKTGFPDFYPGLVSKAHGGVLFIDEIGEMDVVNYNNLLKVIEDGKVSPSLLGASVRGSRDDEEGSGFDESEIALITNGVPARFILIGATNKNPSELPRNFTSRFVTVSFKPLSNVDRKRMVRETAARVGMGITESAIEIISNFQSNQGRELVSVLTVAYSSALRRDSETILEYDSALAVKLLCGGDSQIGFRQN